MDQLQPELPQDGTLPKSILGDQIAGAQQIELPCQKEAVSWVVSCRGVAEQVIVLWDCNCQSDYRVVGGRFLEHVETDLCQTELCICDLNRDVALAYARLEHELEDQAELERINRTLEDME